MTPLALNDMIRAARILHSPDIGEWMEAVADDRRTDPDRKPAAARPPDRRTRAGPLRPG